MRFEESTLHTAECTDVLCVKVCDKRATCIVVPQRANFSLFSRLNNLGASPRHVALILNSRFMMHDLFARVRPDCGPSLLPISAIDPTPAE